MNPFVGPSYTLTSRKADVQRSVNFQPVQIESGSGKSPTMLKRTPGLKTFATLGGAPIRAAQELNGRLFAVMGSTLYEVMADATFTSRGTIQTTFGPVSLAFNRQQLVLVDGLDGYTLTLADNTFEPIIDEDFPACQTVTVTDGYAIVTQTDSGQFNISAIDDAQTWNALDFANAETYPDNAVCAFANLRDLYLMGRKSIEVWQNTGAADFPFQRTGTILEIGIASPFSVAKVGAGLVMWVGSDDRGGPVVWGMEGYQPRRVSTIAIEQSLKDADLSQAVGFAYTLEGSACYVLQVPGLSSTWVFDSTNGAWHERADFRAGQFAQWRATCYAYAFGKHLIGGSDGVLYELRHDVFAHGSDPMVSTRISPHEALPTFQRERYPKFELDMTVGGGGSVLMRYSDDGGNTWCNWRTASMGDTGKFGTRILFWRCGFARDRVWEVRVTDNVRADIVSVQT